MCDSKIVVKTDERRFVEHVGRSSGAESLFFLSEIIMEVENHLFVEENVMNMFLCSTLVLSSCTLFNSSELHTGTLQDRSQ